jgi:choline dehydrogenase-like flavoprotein
MDAIPKPCNESISRYLREWDILEKYTIPTTPYPSKHNLGTNRMSTKPRDGMVNKWGQSHDISILFVSDGSQSKTSAA